MSWRLLLWGSLCLASWAAAAEELPPPADQRNQPPPLERRERLRRLGGQLLDALVPPTSLQTLESDALNRVLADLLAPLASARGYLESIELQFVPEATDLAADRAAVRAAVLLRRSVWSPEPSRLEVTVQGRVQASQAGPPVACVEGQATLETDVLSLAEFALARARDPLALHLQREAPTAEPGLARLAYDKLNRTGRITTLDELADVLAYLAGLKLQFVNEQIESLHAALAAGPAEPHRSELEQELREARERRDRLFELRPRIERNELGVAQKLTVSLNSGSLGPPAQAEQLELSVTEHEMALRTTLQFTQGVEWYLAFKPLVLGTLARLQSGDPALLNSVRALRDQWHERMRELLDPTPPAP
jgi:hypothetical protein